jgi:hypothetical protein
MYFPRRVRVGECYLKNMILLFYNKKIANFEDLYETEAFTALQFAYLELQMTIIIVDVVFFSKSIWLNFSDYLDNIFLFSELLPLDIWSKVW